MSLNPALPDAIVQTVLDRLAILFLAGAAGDIAHARAATAQMLADYGPRNRQELRLAAEIISFSFHALEALSQAATPGMSLTRVLRLRGSAVSLSRESHKAQRRLDQLQRARQTGDAVAPAPESAAAQPAAAEPSLQNDAQPDTQPARPRVERAIQLVEQTRECLAQAATPAANQAVDGTAQTWTQAYQQRQRDRRLANKPKQPLAAPAASAETVNAQFVPATQVPSHLAVSQITPTS